MDAGRGALAGGEQSRQRGSAVRIRGDPAHVIVAGRRDRYRLRARIDPAGQTGREDAREFLGEMRADRVAGVEEGAAPGLALGVDGAGHHVARRELGVG